MTNKTCKRVPHKFINKLDRKRRRLAAALAADGYAVIPNQPFNLIVKGS